MKLRVCLIRGKIGMGALVNGISGDVEPSFEIFNVRVKIIMGPLVLIHGNGISGDVERIFEILFIFGVKPAWGLLF